VARNKKWKGEKIMAILYSKREAGQPPTFVLRDAFYNNITAYVQVISTKKVVGKNHSNSFKSLKRL
jgi:hypothetical protein